VSDFHPVFAVSAECRVLQHRSSASDTNAVFGLVAEVFDENISNSDLFRILSASFVQRRLLS